jgi:hypothetical protein
MDTTPKAEGDSPSQVTRMRTEAKRFYNTGFVLTEAELRRLHDVMASQMRRSSAGENYSARYEVKYRNGSIAEPNSLDDISSQENFGSGAITRLKLTLASLSESPPVKLSVEFSITEDEPDERPIHYTVLGDDRDWVFVTSSQIDERLGKVRRLNVNRLVQNRDFSRFSFAILMLFAMGGIFFSLDRSSDESFKTHLSSLTSIENDWKDGTLKDPVAAFLRLERERLNFRVLTPKVFYVPVIVAMITLLVMGLLATAKYFWPPWNFLWGDYVAVYEKRRAYGRWIFGTLLFGLGSAVVTSIFVDSVRKWIGL